MTTADLIAVMNLGRIEQLGSPEDIYDRPRSEFVARFIGAANILKGKALDRDHVRVAGVPLRCVGAALTPGSDAAISIRQHEVLLTTAAPVGTSDNMLPGTVTRNVFLGNSRDYMVELADGTPIRAVSAPHASIPQGAKVWLHMPHERCRALLG
jgi:iron(III) transport system ATP-binding protein